MIVNKVKTIILILIYIFLFQNTNIFVYAKPTYLNDEKAHFINVAAATLWKSPQLGRLLDEPSLNSPVDLEKWTESMKLADKMWLVGKLETQALYGQQVELIEEKGDWAKIVVLGQPTPNHERGYPGWIPKKQLATTSTFMEYKDNHPFAVIKKRTSWLYDDPSMKKPFMEISFNTQIPAIKQYGDIVKVRTPDGNNKWVKLEDVAIHEAELSIPYPSGEDIVTSAKMFLDLPYLWAGTSGFGFDCSGFTHSMYKSHGITIPRDASVQARKGIAVTKDNLKPGDLMFFAYEKGKGKVHHVSMYIGDGKMIHSPNSAKSVEIISIDVPTYSEEFTGARRYLKQQ